MKAGGSSLTNFLKAAICDQNCTGGPCRSACAAGQLLFMQCDRAFKKFPRFFRWTVARDPFSRAVSAWGMANRFRKPQQPPFGLDEWALDPVAVRTQTIPMHWMPQADFLFGPGGCPLFHFAGFLDARLGDDLQAVLARIGSPRLWEHYRAHGIPHDFAADRAKNDAAACAARPETWDLLAKRYQEDFRLLGFDPAAARPRQN